MRLVETVHREVAQVINAGDLAIDATIGNGHDTEFLMTLGAQVIGFDIQEAAILSTEKRLKDYPGFKQVTLYQEGHEQMLEFVPKDWIGSVQVVMFNLGYLPGGDKSCITQAETTLKGLKSAYHLLKPGGYLSIMLYPDHPGGLEEAQAVKAWINSIEGGIKHIRPGTRGPEWLWVKNGRD